MHAAVEGGEDGGRIGRGPQVTKKLQGLRLWIANEALEEVGMVLEMGEVFSRAGFVDAVDVALAARSA